MSKVHKALFITIFTQHSIQIVNLAFTVILARLISPAELGVYAISSSVVILAIELRALGIGPYLIREEHLNSEKIKSATGLMLVISGGLGLLIFAGAPLASHFYREPALKILLWITAATFFLTPFSSVPNALITREMKFHQIFVIKIVSTLVLTVSTILLVLLGYSYYGMAWGIFLGALSEFFLNNYYRPKGAPWLPSFKGISGMMRFGIYLSMSQLFVRFSESISDLVLGRIGSKAEVGMFSRGFGFLLFVNRIIGQAVEPLILPFLSETRRDGGSVKQAYIKIILLQGAFSMPIFAVIHVAAFPAIRLLFGEQWDSAVPIASIMTYWAIFQSIHGFSSSALISLGEEKLMFNSSLVIFILRVLAIILASTLIHPFSLEAVAWSFALSGFLELVVKAWAIQKAMRLSFWAQFLAMLPNLMLMSVCWVGALVLNFFLPFSSTPPWESILILLAVMPVLWLSTLFLLKHELSKIILNFLKKLKSPPPPSSVNS